MATITQDGRATGAPTKTKFTLLPDRPIDSEEDDQLSRKLFARSIAKAILNYNYSASVVIALYGTWGSGKSSVINLTRQYIIKDSSGNGGSPEQPVFLEFNPWNYLSHSDLITQYLNTLSDTLYQHRYGKRLASDIGRALKKYSRKLQPTARAIDTFIPGVASGVTAVGTALGTILDQDDTTDLAKLKENISGLLKREKRKIVVIIDDIDRLADDQIRNMFQLIGSLGDFPNTVYLLACDREIVSRALDKTHDQRGDAYLEKIVQFSLEVPTPRQADLADLFKTQLMLILQDHGIQLSNQSYWQDIHNNCVMPYLTSPRDIKRYVNSVKFSIGMVCDNLDIIDFLALTALQIFEPRAFFGIRDSFHLSSEGLSTLNSADKKGAATARGDLDIVVELFTSLPQKYARQWLATMFPIAASVYHLPTYSGEFEFDARRLGRICHPDNFHTFFCLARPESEVSRDDVERILSVDISKPELEASLGNLADNGKLPTFLARFSDHIKSFSRERDFQNVIGALLKFACSTHVDDPPFWDYGNTNLVSRAVW